MHVDTIFEGRGGGGRADVCSDKIRQGRRVGQTGRIANASKYVFVLHSSPFFVWWTANVG